MRQYSRLQSIEQRKNIKKAYLYIFLSIVTLVLLLFLGIPTIVKLAGFIGRIGKANTPVEIVDTTPPAPPQIDNIPEFTNQNTIEINGKAEEGSVVKISANNKSYEVVSDANGNFNFNLNLKDGENFVNFKAKDGSGNESQTTPFYKIIFDNQNPEITIDSPLDGTSFYGQSQRQLLIKGKVSEMVDLKINGKVIAVKDDLTFAFSTTLQEGENKFEVKAKDPSGNESSTLLTINFVF